MSLLKRKIETEASTSILAKLRSLHSDEIIEVYSTQFTIGRCIANNKIFADLSISRNHCVFQRDELLKKWTLRDTSSQGTFVNGLKINSNTPVTIDDGDTIQFSGLSEYTYEFTALDDFHEKKKCKNGDILISATDWQSQFSEPEQSSSQNYPSQILKCKGDLLNELKIDKDKLASQLSTKEGEINELKLELANQKILLSEKEEIIEKKEKETNINNPSTNVQLDLVSGIVDSELQCTICSDLLIKATTLNCSHTFCKYCLDQWKNSKRTCPMCRVNITCETRCLVVDNLIEKLIENSSEEVKNKRQEVMEERSVQELMASGPPSKRSRNGGRRTRFLSHAIHRRGNSFPRRHSGPVIVLDNSQLQINLEPITLSSDLSSDDDFDSDMISVSSIDTDDDVFSYDSDIHRPRAPRRAEYVEGLPGYPYGGYGYCYICGAEGHWAPGCPEQ